MLLIKWIIFININIVFFNYEYRFFFGEIIESENQIDIRMMSFCYYLYFKRIKFELLILIINHELLMWLNIILFSKASIVLKVIKVYCKNSIIYEM